MVGLLVSHGAAVEAADAYGFAPLHRFVQNNLIYGACSLLSAGAVTRAAARWGRPPPPLLWPPPPPPPPAPPPPRGGAPRAAGGGLGGRNPPS